MSSHLEEENDPLTPEGIRILIATVIRGKRTKGDEAKAVKEAKDRAALHGEKKGDSKPPKVTEDDVPFDLTVASEPDDTPSEDTEEDESDG